MFCTGRKAVWSSNAPLWQGLKLRFALFHMIAFETKRSWSNSSTPLVNTKLDGIYGRSSLILWKVVGIEPQRLLRKSELESFFLPNRFLSRRWMTAHLGPPQVVAETWQHLSSDRGRPLSDAQSLECNFRCGYGSKFKTWGTTDIANSWYQASNYWGTQFWPVPYPCVLIGKVKFQTMISRWWLTLWLCKGTGCCCCSANWHLQDTAHMTPVLEIGPTPNMVWKKSNQGLDNFGRMVHCPFMSQKGYLDGSTPSFDSF